MPISNATSTIAAIHNSGKQLVLSVTGGGSRAIAALLEVPGASATVLEAVVPYSAPALREWLGGPIDQACSEPTARAMAMASFERARALSTASPRDVLGIGATASLATNRSKRGPHRTHVAWQSATHTVVASCELKKGARDRAAEEAIAAAMVLDAVTEACGEPRTPVKELGTDELIVRREKLAPSEWTELHLGERQAVTIGASASSPKVLFPGAFHPLHHGHQRMAETAAKRLGAPVTWELSITNVDKPPLDFIEIDDRLSQLRDRDVLLSRAPTFVEKAALAPGCTFVVGVDTIVRIADPRYYGDDLAARNAAIRSIADQDCRFLVFGRSDGDRFVTLVDVKLPPDLAALCDAVADFREDVSSTGLRTSEEA